MSAITLSLSSQIAQQGREEKDLRDDLSANTDGLLLGVVELSGSGVNDLSVDLVGPPTVVSEDVGSGLDITLGLGNGLSVVEGLDGGKEEQVLLEEVRKVVQVPSTVLGSDLGPLALEGGTGSLDGNVDILFKPYR